MSGQQNHDPQPLPTLPMRRLCGRRIVRTSSTATPPTRSLLIQLGRDYAPDVATAPTIGSYIAESVVRFHGAVRNPLRDDDDRALSDAVGKESLADPTDAL